MTYLITYQNNSFAHTLRIDNGDPYFTLCNLTLFFVRTDAIAFIFGQNFILRKKKIAKFCRISLTSLIKAWPEENCVVTPDDLETFERDIVDAPFTVPGKPEVWSIPSIPYGF